MLEYRLAVDCVPVIKVLFFEVRQVLLKKVNGIPTMGGEGGGGGGGGGSLLSSFLNSYRRPNKFLKVDNSTIVYHKRGFPSRCTITPLSCYIPLII